MSVPVFQPVIEGFWVRNFRVLKQIAVGSSFQQSIVMDGSAEMEPYELTPFTTFIGPSGIGKTTILDAFAFLSDCLKSGLDEALSKRGGFEAVYSRTGDGPMSLGIVYRTCSEPRPITYAISINKKPGTAGAYIETEAVVYRTNHVVSSTQSVLFFQNGDKTTRHVHPWHGAKPADIERIKRTDNKHLALQSLGEFDDLPDVPQLKRHLEGFHFACYTPDNAAGLTQPLYRPVKKDSLHAEFNRMKEKHHFEFPKILEVIAQRLPGMENVYSEITESGRTILYFKKKNEEKPYGAQEIGEGTLRLFSHLLMLEDPMPIPLIGIEEPAAYMDEIQMQSLANHFRRYFNELGGSQFFMTTTNTALIDQLDPTEVWTLYQDEQGNVRTIRALDDLMFRGVDLNNIGPYWYTDYVYRNNIS